MALAVARAEAPEWHELDGRMLRLEDRAHADALAWREEMSELRVRLVEVSLASEADSMAGTPGRAWEDEDRQAMAKRITDLEL